MIIIQNHLDQKIQIVCLVQKNISVKIVFNISATHKYYKEVIRYIDIYHR